MDSYQDLWKAIPSIQLHFSCETCKQRYMKGWLQSSPTQCLFCRSYQMIEHHTRAVMMREAEWIFLQTGLEDKGAFYSDYLNQIHRWANAMEIPYTAEDARVEYEWIQEWKHD